MRYIQQYIKVKGIRWNLEKKRKNFIYIKSRENIVENTAEIRKYVESILADYYSIHTNSSNISSASSK